jgi:hypothetical protein
MATKGTPGGGASFSLVDLSAFDSDEARIWALIIAGVVIVLSACAKPAFDALKEMVKDKRKYDLDMAKLQDRVGRKRRVQERKGQP